MVRWLKKDGKQNSEEVDITQITAKFIFQLPFCLKMQEVRSIRPKSVKRQGEEIIIYPPVYAKTLIEERLWQLKTQKPRITQLDKLNCIVIDIRRDFQNLQKAEEASEELLAKARENLYQLLNLCRKRGILHIGIVNIEKLDYRLRFFDADGNIIKATGMTHLTLPRLPFKSKDWNDICQDLASNKLPEIYEIFLLDAESVVSSESRRAVLDTAIACEVFIKNFCEVTRKNKNIGQVEYKDLKRKRRNQGEILFYFDKILKFLIGHSLRCERPSLYCKIDCLRLTNNSIKHNGKCEYEKGGKVTEVKYHEVYDFITAVKEAIEYTRSLESK